jgi:hypothetical protein
VPPVPAAYLPNSPTARPGSVTTAGVLAMIFGVIGTLSGLILVITAGTAEFRQAGESPGTLRVIGAVSLVVCLFMVVTGRLVLKGRSWARRVLTVLFGLGVVVGVLGGMTAESIGGLVVCALVVIMLWTKGSRRWFTRAHQ